MARRTIGEAVGHLCDCARARTLADVPDGQLLERFANHREEAAFAALLLRHGSMVLHVCRRVLGRWVSDTYRRRPMIIPVVLEV